jgi:hypothetical protein
MQICRHEPGDRVNLIVNPYNIPTMYKCSDNVRGSTSNDMFAIFNVLIRSNQDNTFSAILPLEMVVEIRTLNTVELRRT